MFLGLLSGAKEKVVWLNWIGFKLKPLSLPPERASEHPVSASVGLEGTAFGLESCLSAEEAYLLDKENLYRDRFICQSPMTLCLPSLQNPGFTVDWKGAAIFHCHISC